MLFDKKIHTIKILSVLELSWHGDNRSASPRSFHALSFRINGDADFIYGDCTSHVKTNSVAFVPKGLSYRLQHKSEHLYVVHFETEDTALFQKLFTFTPRVPQIYFNIFKNMYEIWNSKKTGYYYAVCSLFFSLLEEIEKDMTSRLTSASDRLLEVTEYIHRNFSDPLITVSRLAELFGTSETYFRRVFKSAYNTTPLKYINRMRLEYAMELLQSGYYSVSEISDKAGFSDPKYFSRVVRQKKMQPPSKIRGL